MKEAILLALFSSLTLPLVAQRDTLWHKDLKEVAITAERSKVLTLGHKSETPDSVLKSNHKFSMLATLLDATSGLVIRSYGPGILATTSLRGGNSQQTALAWNGITLNHPASGVCDLNLVPSFFFDGITLQAGLTSTLQGSGAISGAINLSNSLASKPGHTLEALQSIGSFGSYNSGLGFTLSKNKWNYTVKAFGANTKNNYPYINTTEAGNPWRKVTNAKSQVYSILHETAYRSSYVGVFSLSYWGTLAQRQIPPMMLMEGTDAHQSDQIHRLKLQWQKSFHKIHLHYHSYYQKDEMRYNESFSEINSIAKSTFSTNDLEMRFKTLKHSKNGMGLIHTYAFTNISNILPADTVLYNRSNRHLFAFWLSHIQKIPNLRTTLSASTRIEMINSEALPITPSIGINVLITKKFSVYGQVCKVFRFPTLNDLYWIPGGNPTLKPESGWAQEFTAEYHKTKSNTKRTFSITGFNRNIANWIQWQPVTSQIWSPFNLGRVRSRGLEIRGHFSNPISKKIMGRAGFSFDYTQSINIDPSQASYGKQLLYIPFLKSTGFMAMIYKNSSLSIQGTSVGKRYTSSDNLDSLPLYGLLNVSFNQTVFIKKHLTQLYFKANNLLNQSYQAIVWRPMPGINFEFGISIQIQSNIKNTKPSKPHPIP